MPESSVETIVNTYSTDGQQLITDWAEEFRKAKASQPASTAAAGPASPAKDPEVGKLVEKAGKRFLFWFAHRDEWGDAEEADRRGRLSADIDRALAALSTRGETLETYGWSLSPSGLWHRVGEEAAELPEGDATRFLRSLYARLEALGLGVAPAMVLRALDERIECACSRGDLSDLEAACEEYARVWVAQGADRRGALLERAAAARFPSTQLRPGLCVEGGETAWSTFCAAASAEFLALAETALLRP